jgi:hypothetical protein
MEPPKSIERTKRALTTEMARIIRQRGHNDATEFAMAIGLIHGYKNDPHAKKDVIDPSGDAHSVKSGDKKWQIFLYGYSRFQTDDAFAVMNGLGALLLQCIDAFPRIFAEYEREKDAAKERLRIPMRQIAEKLQEKARLRAFLNKSLFNGGEVNYLTVKHEGKFHVFLNKDVIDVLGDSLEVCNSRAITLIQKPEQKVLLRYKGLNVGELEMRNESPVHYREIRFNMIKPKVMSLLFAKIPKTSEYNNLVYVYSNASKSFGRWKKSTRAA